MIQISNLILEVTRKCNLKCAHCLRGDVQRMTMSNAVIFKAMGWIDSISTLTITGGEPSLAPEVLEYLLETFRWKRTQVGAFYIVTNGMPHNRYRRFLDAVEHLYGWCDEQSACTLTVSRDQYHPFNDNHWRNLEKFEVHDENGKHWGEYPPYFYPDARNHRIERALGEGRAIKTQTGFEPQEQQKPWELDSVGDYVIDPEVYISANGNVCSACNMSFDRIDAESRGNVLETSLQTIIESYSTKQPEEVQEVAA